LLVSLKNFRLNQLVQRCDVSAERAESVVAVNLVDERKRLKAYPLGREKSCKSKVAL
jgi:hypothetical protein